MDQQTPLPKSEGGNSWIQRYYDKLGNLGWQFSNNIPGRINSAFVAANDTESPKLLDAWRMGGNSVEISIVIVPPNGDLSDLPTRALAYSASALNFALNLRKSGVTVDTLRIMSPCYANIYANGGNLDPQITNAKKMQELIMAYQENYLPELNGAHITLDIGNPITQDVEQHLLPRVNYVQAEHPDIAEDLLKVSQRYSANGTSDHLLDESQRPLAYLLAHPPAWGYSEETILFDRNGDRRINFMPASELRYLEYMKRIEGKAWIPSQDKQIATVISAKQTHAPYHKMLKSGQWGDEPTIEDLTKGHSALQTALNRLSQNSFAGNIQAHEVKVNLNQLQWDAEQAVRKRLKLGLSKPKPLNELISEIVNNT